MGVEEVTITAVDGDCRAFVCTPDTDSRFPAVIFYMDGLGIRPTLVAMCERLAALGYVVLLPDLFYRIGAYEPLDAAAVFASGDARSAMAPFLASTDTARAAADTASFLSYLDSRADVAGSSVGTTGYCMGGGISLAVAGTYPARVAAAASFHGGRLITDSDLSPHRLVSNIAAQVYVAGADHDRSYPPEMAAELDRILTDAGVNHRCEIYPDALHGFAMADFPVYNERAAERHWSELEALFATALPR